jgi:4,5-dihydroxyphthalate decarboxylase
MDKLRLNFACGPYDRMEALASGEVKPEGIDLTYTMMEDPRELFDRLMMSGDFDLAEMSSSEHIANTVAGTSPFVALPVFPSKVYRHSFICHNVKSGIKTPKDLAGRRIGVPLYTMSAALWCRGMLEDEYGVDLSDVTWVQGNMYKAGSHGNPSAPPLLRPLKLENNSAHSLSELLERGEIDATIGALTPSGLGVNPDIVRMFPNFREVEVDYYRRTKIHPIMHLVVIRKAVYEKNPWIAKPLYEAFEASKRSMWQKLQYSGAQRVMLPWLYADIEEIKQTFGDDPWPYGIEANRPTLTKAVEYMYRDAMISRKPSPDELFVDVGA